MTLDRSECGAYSPAVLDLAQVFGRSLGLALNYGRQSQLLLRLSEQLGEQNRLLSERVEGRADACRLIESCRSQPMAQVAHLARQVAGADTPVLITGATGTGKEVLASAIHGWSARAARPLVSVNCAALPEALIESELFGHVPGAFSGATGSRMGRFQAANGGTLFLDEVGEIPTALQAKLLRVLQDGTFQPVGSDRTVRVDVRVIAATNADLAAAVRERRFREDLYYRLAVFPIQLPPLRARREDVAPIAASFLERLARRTGRGPWRLGRGAVRYLESRDWPGNVRELVNALERATLLAPGPELDPASLDGAPAPSPDAAGWPPPAGPDDGAREPGPAAGPRPLAEVERDHVAATLRHTGGKLWGPGGAAELLGLNPSTLQSRMKKLGLGGARDHRARAPDRRGYSDP